MVRKSNPAQLRPEKKRNIPLPPPIDVDALAVQQGVKPIDNPKDLAADFWPEDEMADQIVEAIRQWRREGQERGGA